MVRYGAFDGIALLASQLAHLALEPFVLEAGGGGKHVPLWNRRRGSSAIGLHIDGREVIRIFVLDETFR